ncbi:hypothetical protein Tco_1353773 [Tanacetum coccineum]
MRVRLWIQHKHESPCASSRFHGMRWDDQREVMVVMRGGVGTLRGGEIGEFKKELVDGGVEEVGDLSLESMEDEEVSLVDGIFEGAFGALDDETWFLGAGGEALMDAIEVVEVEDE